MAIANSYFNSSPITDSDIFVGTKYATNRTVNYTAQSIADYLNVNARISISGQLTFKFTILPNVAKTIAFENGGGDGRLFSSIDKLIVSILDAGGSNITVFLDYLIDSEILLAEQNQPNSFGHYKITSYTITANPNFYELNLEYIGGNGNIYKDVYYDMTPWASSGSIGTTPDLQQVTDINNVTENDLIVRSPEYERKQVIIKRATDADDTSSVFVQYDADTYVIAYAQEGQSGIGGSVYDPAGISEFILNCGSLSIYNSVDSMSLQGGSLNLFSYAARPKISMGGVGGAVEIRTNLLTGNRLQEVPDKNGTFAMLDDITGGGTVTSVGLTMPSAFMVTNSPITSSGDIAVTGAGAVSQYVRGDGTLANFPTSASGGFSISYYLNGGTAASVATYYQMNKIPVIGTGVDFSKAGNGLISQWLTDVADPNRLEIPAGNWNFEMYMNASSSGGTPAFYVELLKYDGTTFTTISNSSAVPEAITSGTTIDLYLTSLAIPQTTLLVTDRLAIRVYIVNSTGGRTITMHTQDSHLCQIITNFAGGVTSLNGLTTNTQYFDEGITGTDFNISSTTDTHTFNLPTASASNRGALSSADWTTFNNKQDVATLLIDSIDKAILRNNYFWFLPNTVTNGSAASFGYSERISSTTFVILLNGVITRGMVAFSTTAIAGTIASMRQHNGLQLQGYECKFTRKIQFNSNVSGQRFFCGISKGNQFAIATNVEPDTLTNIVGVCQLSTSTNMHIVYNDASGTAFTSDLGSSYPCNDSQYNYYITIEQTTTSYIITVERVTVATGASISTSLTTSTNIPVYNTGIIQLFTFITNNATASIASYLDGGAIGSFKN